MDVGRMISSYIKHVVLEGFPFSCTCFNRKEKTHQAHRSQQLLIFSGEGAPSFSQCPCTGVRRLGQTGAINKRGLNAFSREA